MKDIFKDKVVIVTGASSGIGEAIAREFAYNGSKVVLAARSEDLLAVIVRELKKLNYDAFFVKTDVSREEDCRNLIDRTIEKYGTIDILVNNAGLSMRASFVDVDLKVLHRLMDVNFWGTVYCTKYALPYLIAQKGSLIGVSSVAGFHGLPGRTGYSASKFAIHGFLETIRIENLKKGLHVMIIAPGFTSTEIRKHALTACGEEQGESPRDERKLMPPEYVAKWVIKGIRKKKRNKLLTVEGKLTALFQRIVPDLVDWAYYFEMSREPKSPIK
jgi:short-subunit dehydrogenase